MIKFEDVQLVAAISNGRSIRRAQASLGGHVATHYRRLRALELRVGGPLFAASGDGLVPTARAEPFLEAASELADRLAEVERKVAAQDERLVGPLKVTTADSLLPLVCECLLAFADAHARVEIELEIANSFADLGRREADVAIRPTISPPETLLGRRVAEFGFALFEAEGARDAWIGFGPQMASVPAARWLEDTIDAGGTKIKASGMWVAAQAAALGWGRAILPDYLGAHFGLRQVGPAIPEMRSELWVLFHPDLRCNARVREFVAFAAQWLRRRFEALR